jgi:hypothetical protein
VNGSRGSMALLSLNIRNLSPRNRRPFTIFADKSLQDAYLNNKLWDPALGHSRALSFAHSSSKFSDSILSFSMQQARLEAESLLYHGNQSVANRMKLSPCVINRLFRWPNLPNNPQRLVSNSYLANRRFSLSVAETEKLQLIRRENLEPKLLDQFRDRDTLDETDLWPHSRYSHRPSQGRREQPSPIRKRTKEWSKFAVDLASRISFKDRRYPSEVEYLQLSRDIIEFLAWSIADVRREM